jgi:hypothetical protein
MMSLGELQINFPLLFFCTKISPDDIISINFDSEKVDQDEVFYYKDTLHFFLEWLKYYTYKKSYLGLVAL